MRIMRRRPQGLIADQELKDHFPRKLRSLTRGLDLHARGRLADAGSGEHARAGIHDTKAADADGSLVLQVAKRGNVDAVHLRSFEERSACRERAGSA